MMNLTSSSLKVFLALDPCDMRKSFNGLSTLASDQLQADPACDAFFETFCCDPGASSVEVEKFDAVATLVGEHEKGVESGVSLELVGSESAKAVEGFSHVAGIDREEDLETGAGEVHHK